MLLLTLLGCERGFDREPVAEVSLTVEELPGREWKRLNIDQVDASLQESTGGHGWTEDGENLFESLSGTLGKPDYLGATEEDTTPGLLFQKFLDDAGKQSCRSFVWDEFAKGDSERLWLVGLTRSDDHASSPALVEEAMTRGFLRFHGTRVTDDALQPWLEAFNQAVAETGDVPGGWTMICVGYVTHPDFYGH